MEYSVSTLKTNTLQAATGTSVNVASGHVLQAPGHVIQTVQFTEATDYTTTSTSFQQGPQTGTFTMKNSSNKVLVMIHCLMYANRSSAAGGRFAIYRGTIASGTRLTQGSEPQFYATDAGSQLYSIVNAQFLDTPNASTVTYSIGYNKHPSAYDVHIKATLGNTYITMQEIAQ